jgi:hypothetical protein
VGEGGVASAVGRSERGISGAIGFRVELLCVWAIIASGVGDRKVLHPLINSFYQEFTNDKII